MAETVVGRIKAVITADSKGFKLGIDEADGSLKRFGANATKIGKTMTMGVTLPLVGAGTAAVKMALDFEKSMASIVGLVGIASDEVHKMGETARVMAVEMGGSATQAADALYFVTSAGLTGETAMSALNASLMASAIGLGDVSIIADLASSALNAYGAENLNAMEATDIVTAAVREGKVEADALAASMGGVIPMASAMGVEFHEVGAAFAAMSRTGTDANEAATQINGILGALMKPSKQAEDALRSLGVSSGDLRAELKEKGLLATLQHLYELFGDNESAASLVFGNVRALKGVLSMMGSAAEGTQIIFDKLTNTSGDTAKAFAYISETAGFKMNQAMSRLKELMLSLGQAILPMAASAFGAVGRMLEKVANLFKSLPDPVQKTVILLGAIAAATGPLLLGIGLAVKAFLALQAAALTLQISMGPLIAVTAAVAAGMAIVTWWMAKSGAEAQQAADRQNAMTSALSAAAGPTTILFGEIQKLAAEYQILQGAAEGAGEEVFGGVATYITGALGANAELKTAFNDLGLSISQVGGDIEETSRQYSFFDDILSNDAVSDKSAMIVTQLENLVATGDTWAQSLLDQYAAGELSGEKLEMVAGFLGDTAKAFQEAEVAKSNDIKAWLLSAEAIEYFTQVMTEDAYLALIDSAQLTAKASGEFNIYGAVLEIVTGEAERLGLAVTGTGEAIEETDTATTAGVSGLGNYEEALKAALLASTEGEVTVDALRAAFYGAANETNNMNIALVEAEDSANTLFKGLSKGDGTVLDLQKAIIKTADDVDALGALSKNLGLDLSLAQDGMYDLIGALIAGGQEAGFTADQILDTANALGLLDGMAAAIGIDITVLADMASIEATIDTITASLSGLTGGALERATDQLGKLTRLRDSILKPRGGGSRGGGGGGGSRGKKEDPWEWVKGWVTDIAKAGNDIISKDFAKILLEGSAEEIMGTADSLFAQAATLGLDQLDAFKPVLARSLANFKELIKQANLRDLLLEQIDTAKTELETLKDSLKSIREEAYAFSSTITGAQAPSRTLLDQAQDAQKQYEDLLKKNETLKQQAADFRTNVSSMMAPPLTAGGSALGQTRKVLEAARTFQSNLMALRDKGFPPSVLQEVINAGVLDGNKIAKGLLGLSGSDMSDFLSMREEIAALGAETGAIAADVLFGADIAASNGELATQRGLVETLFANAISAAEAAVATQATVVSGLETSLDATTLAIAALTETIQTDLYDTVFTFLAGFQDGVSQLTGTPSTTTPSRWMADGGIVTSPQIVGVGEAGPEAIIPLSALGNMGGSTYITVQVNGSVTTQRDLVEAIRVGLLKAQKNGKQVVL
jgi:TP901 family phage tail tape measure protein